MGKVVLQVRDGLEVSVRRLVLKKSCINRVHPKANTREDNWVGLYVTFIYQSGNDIRQSKYGEVVGSIETGTRWRGASEGNTILVCRVWGKSRGGGKSTQSDLEWIGEWDREAHFLEGCSLCFEHNWKWGKRGLQGGVRLLKETVVVLLTDSEMCLQDNLKELDKILTYREMRRIGRRQQQHKPWWVRRIVYARVCQLSLA